MSHFLPNIKIEVATTADLLQWACRTPLHKKDAAVSEVFQRLTSDNTEHRYDSRIRNLQQPPQRPEMHWTGHPRWQGARALTLANARLLRDLTFWRASTPTSSINRGRVDRIAHNRRSDRAGTAGTKGRRCRVGPGRRPKTTKRSRCAFIGRDDSASKSGGDVQAATGNGRKLRNEAVAAFIDRDDLRANAASTPGQPREMVEFYETTPSESCSLFVNSTASVVSAGHSL